MISTITVGQIIGKRYQIIEQIGRGGFGITFKATDTQESGNPVCVVKQFKPQDPKNWKKGLELFEREAEKLKELGIHDQIPRFIDCFTENQEYYLVQEYIEGHDLSKELQAGKQYGENDVIKLLQDILEILTFVHQNSLIHRDLKPSNIRRRASDGKIVLIDFGSVKEVATRIVNHQGQVNYVTGIHSPGYTPIEQSHGRAAVFASDIYAVGVIAIQALTGIDPSGSPIFNSHPGEIIWHNSAQVSKKLADIIDKMVRRDHNQRYQSAAEALQAINELLIPPPPPPPPPPPLPWIKWLAAGVGIIAVVTMMIIWIKSQPHPLSKEYSQSGIKIKYPDNWKPKEAGDFGGDLIQFIPQNLQQKNSCVSQITINKHELSRTLTWQEYINTVKQRIKKNNPNTVITDETNSATTLSQKDAYRLVFFRTENQCQFQVQEIGTVSDGNGYYISYTAPKEDYNKYLREVEEMINSFKIQHQKQ